MTLDSPATPKPKKPLWRRLLKWTIRVAVLLIVLGIAAYAITSYWASKTIHTELARIRAAGEPLTFVELNKLTPQVNRAQDAGPYYLAAEELVTAEYESDVPNYNMFFGPEPLPDAIPTTARVWAQKAIESNAETLTLLDRGSSLPGCNADIQLEYGIGASLRPLGRTRALANAASVRTRSLAVEGHPDQAIDSLISSLGLLRIFDRQPVLIDALVQVAILNKAAKDAAFILNYSHPTDAALRKLESSFQQVRLASLRQIFIAERVYALELNRNLLAGGIEISPPSPEEPLLPEREHFASLGVVGRVMVAQTLGFQARCIDAASGDWPTNLNTMQQVADSATSIFAKILAPSLTHAMVVYGHSLAAHRSAVIAIQIERYRLAHNNQLPDSLAQLADAATLPTDPFTGKPLLYIKTPDGYCVMSAGRNHPEDDSRHIDRDADPIRWSERWGVHIHTTVP